MAIGSGLERRGAVYYWRKRLPEFLAQRIGANQLRYSLKTKDLAAARYLAASLNAAAADVMLDELANVTKPQLTAVFLATLKEHKRKLAVLADLSRNDPTFDIEEEARDETAMGWSYRLLSRHGAGVAIGPKVVGELREAGLDEASSEAVCTTLRKMKENGQHRPSQFRIADAETVAMRGAFADTEHPLHALLGALNIPWRTPRGELLSRFGIKADPFYRFRRCVIETSEPLFDGLLLPLSFDAHEKGERAPDFPPIVFTATAWWEDDARANMLRAHRTIAARLGPRPIEHQAGTFEVQWRYGPASLRLTVFPPDLQVNPAFNPAHDREPKLTTAVHCTIETGFRPPLNTRERGWLDSLVPVAKIGERTIPAHEIRGTPARDHLLEFVREPPDDIERFRNTLGRSADGEGLVFVGPQLYVAPTALLRGFHVNRLTQAKGGACSWISMSLTSDVASSGVKYIDLTSASGTWALDAFAEHLAEMFDRPFELEEPQPNV